MEKKTMDTLRTMICGELDDIAKKGIISHENLDILKDLLESAKNLEKIEKYQNEKEVEWDMDRGYSQRKYFIDADYDPYGQRMSYGRGVDGYSMRRGYDGRGYMDGNSYMYYDPRYERPMYSKRGYSRASQSEMVEELKGMMMDAKDEKVRNAISNAIAQMEK